MHFLEFEVGGIDFAIHLMDVHSIEESLEIYPYKIMSNDCIKGVTEIREQKIMIYDLQKRMKITQQQTQEYAKQYIIVKYKNKTAALEIDFVKNIIEVKERYIYHVMNQYFAQTKLVKDIIRWSDKMIYILDIQYMMEHEIPWKDLTKMMKTDLIFHKMKSGLEGIDGLVYIDLEKDEMPGFVSPLDLKQSWMWRFAAIENTATEGVSGAVNSTWQLVAEMEQLDEKIGANHSITVKLHQSMEMFKKIWNTKIKNLKNKNDKTKKLKNKKTEKQK